MPGSTPAGTGSCSARSPTRSHRDCCSRRRSAASATTSTRSCSAGPPTCRGASRSTPAHRPEGYAQFATFHPTFLYEALWNLAGIALLLYLDRRLRLGYGRAFAVYVMIYTAGRGWIEALRIDAIELDDVLGLRWGVWMSIILFVGAAAYFVLVGRRHRPPHTREPSPYAEPRRAGADDSAADAPDDSGDPDDSPDESPDKSGRDRRGDTEATQGSQTPPE